MIRPLAPIKKITGSVQTQLRPFLLIIAFAALFGIAVVGVLRTTSLIGGVPAATVPITGWVLSSRAVAFLFGTVVGLLIAGGYLLYRNHRKGIHRYWQQYSTWAQAMIVGTVCALGVGLALGIGSLFDYTSPSVVGLGFLLTWPVSTGLLLLRNRRSGGRSSSISSVKVGYVHTKGLESRTLSVIVGFLIAVSGSLIIWYLGTWYFGRISWLPIALTAVVFWIVVTILIYNRYDATAAERTDLSILTVNSPESHQLRELVIKNTSQVSIDLTESRIRDTEFELYQFGIDVTLGPGATCSFRLPEAFTLEPSDDALELPLGYNLKRGGETPTLFSKTGEIYNLQWAGHTEGGSTLPLDELNGTRSSPQSTTEATPQD